MKTSLEVEYWVVDDDGDLVSADSLLDVADYVDPEFVEPMIEIKTSPCSSTADLRSEFRDRVETVVDAARARDEHLVPLATPLHAAPAEIPYREKECTDLQRRIVGPTFGDARFCAGTHLHVEQSNVVDQLNALTALDPAFALVASSSHHRGERLTACARPYLYRRSCYGPCPEQGQLWPYVDSVDEWEQRLDDAFGRFRDRAIERRVDATAFDAEFSPYDAVWTPVRLRDEFPTVEWRSPDAALPSRILRLAEAVRSTVARADAHGTIVDEPAGAPTVAADGGDGLRNAPNEIGDGRVALPAFETVEAIADEAIRDGLDSPRVRNYLRRFGFDPSAHEPFATRLPDARVTKTRAKKLRLEAARILEADVRAHRPRV